MAARFWVLATDPDLERREKVREAVQNAVRGLEPVAGQSFTVQYGWFREGTGE